MLQAWEVLIGTDTRSSEPAPEAVVSPPALFSPSQRNLVKALRRISPDGALSDMFEGAIRVLGDSSNPERFSLAAHGVRELIEKIAEYAAVPMEANRQNLKEKIVPLENAWSQCSSHVEHVDSTTPIVIDVTVVKFLRNAGDFFAWFRTYFPRRRSEYLELIRRLELNGQQLPPRLQSLNVEEWMEIRDYFVQVSHHRRSTTTDEFSAYVAALERFLLPRLEPRTLTADFPEIDAIIRAGEQ